MKILQLSYSKLPPGESPWKKTGFHTLLVSPEVPRTVVTAIESAIHYPGPAVLPTEKVVLLWQTLHGEPYLVLLWVRTLAAARDEFGREGMFLAHAFLIPPVGWQAVASPIDWVPVLAPLVPATLDDIRQLPGADWQTGHLAPLDLPAPPPAVGPLPPVPEALWLAVSHLARGTWTDGLLISATPPQVLALAEGFYRRLPAAQWPQLGLDPAFDGGKLFFFPLKLVGFTAQEPSTGSPLVYELARGSFRPHPQLAQVATAETPYERYLLADAAPTHLADAWAVSEALLTSHPVPESAVAALPATFWQANAGWLRGQAEARIRPNLGQPWAQWLAEHLPSAAVATWLQHGAPLRELGTLLSKALPHGAAELPRERLPSEVLQTSPLVAAVLAVRQRSDAPPSALAALTPEQAAQVIHLLLPQRLPAAHLLPLVDRLAPADRDALLQHADGLPLIEAWLTERLRGQASLKPVAAHVAAALRAAGQLSVENLTNAQVQHLLANQLSAWASLGLAPVAEWLRPQPPPDVPELAVLLTPPSHLHQLPDAFRREMAARNAYLDLLTQQYRYTPVQLESMGWASGEVADAQTRRKPGWLGRLRQTLGV